ncbi:hypothetical protein RUND412_004269 [Rhizina undulata]
MDFIPLETFYEILSYIPEKDIPSVRLRYFRNIRIPLWESALSKLLHVSSRPELAQCVRHLMYPYWDMYPKDFVKGKELQCDGKFGKALEFALSKMPHVREITAELDEYCWEAPVRHWPEPAILVNDTFPPAEKDILGPFKELMAAASRAQTRLDKLSITPLWRGIFAEGTEFLLNSELLFQNLTSLSMFFYRNGNQVDFDALQKDVKEGRIFKFLSSALKLRFLAVGIHCHPCLRISSVYAMPLHEIFGENYVWKYLETFPFNGRQMHGEDLTHFFARHASTLKTFGLYHPYLRRGTWRGFLDFIKGHPELCLEKLILLDPAEGLARGRWRFYCQERERNRMNGYVLRGGPPYPPTEEELEQQRLQFAEDESSDDGFGNEYFLEDDEYNFSNTYDGSYGDRDFFD